MKIVEEAPREMEGVEMEGKAADYYGKYGIDGGDGGITLIVNEGGSGNGYHRKKI